MFLAKSSHFIMEWYSYISNYHENVRYFLYLFCIYPRICICFVQFVVVVVLFAYLFVC